MTDFQCAHGFYLAFDPDELEIEQKVVRLLDEMGQDVPKELRLRVEESTAHIERVCASHPTLAQQQATIEAHGWAWIAP